MDAQTQLMYTELFQSTREYILYLQQLNLLLLTAMGVIFYNNIKSKNYAFMITICFAFFFGVVNLIVGLFLYGNFLDIISQTSLKFPDISTLRYLIYTQFSVGILILLLIVVAVICVRKRTSNE